MPFEQPPSQENMEQIPTKEEVLSLIETENYSITRELTDEKGLYLLEVETEEQGERKEFSYTRKGRFAECQSTETRIDIVYLDENGIPTGGEPYMILQQETGDWRRV